MLAKPYRIKKATDFSKTYKFGKSYNHNLIYIKALKSHYPQTKVAVVVPKKVSKRAVDRNTYRRQIYEIVRINFDKLQTGFVIILSVKSPLNNIKHQDLEKIVLDGLKQLEVY